MKLSIEAKVAAAVAAGFIALTAVAIGQGDRGTQSGEPNDYGPTENTRIGDHIYDSSLFDDTVSEQDIAGTTSTKHTKIKIGKPVGHYTSQRPHRNR
jgi:hypothetical protein